MPTPGVPPTSSRARPTPGAPPARTSSPIADFGFLKNVERDSGGGFGGFLGNLGGDIRSAIVGFPGGVVKTVTDPIGTAKAIGDYYGETYGGFAAGVPVKDGKLAPAGWGGWREAWRPLYEHPLGPVLDLAFLASVAGGRGAALAQLPAGAGAKATLVAGTTGRTAGPLKALEYTLPSGGKIPGRTLPRNAARAARVKAVNAALNKLPYETRVLGEMSRAARELRRIKLPTKLANELNPVLKEYMQAFGKLDRKERVALHMLGRVPLAKDLEAWRGLIQDKSLLKALDDPKVRRLYDEGLANTDLRRAYEAADRLGRLSENMLVEMNALRRETAEARRYLPVQLARGARFEPDLDTFYKTPEGDVVRPVGYSGAGAKRERFYTRPTGETQLVEVLMSSGRTVERKLPTHSLTQVLDPDEIPFRHREKLGKKLIGSRPLDELRGDIEAAGRPQPLYLPDMPAKPKRVYTGASAGGPRTPPLSPVRQSEGTLFTLGQLALEPDVLSPSYLRTVKFAYYRDLHDGLMDASVQVPKGDGLPPRHVWIRARRGERIPHTETTRGTFREQLADLFPDDDTTPGLVSKSALDALEENGIRYAVPEAFARQVTGEFVRSSTAVRLLIERPLSVWRALVLNLRVGWLTNNLVGNHLLYALKNAGPDGVRAYIAMLTTTRGAAYVRRFLRRPEARNSLTDADMRELLPELVSGTFIGTQTPTTGVAGRVNRVASLGGRGLAPIDRATEGALRRAAANAALRRSPEVKARMKAMPKEAQSFREASRQELKQNQKLRRLVVDDVNDTLGNFLDLSPAERGVVRNAVPFYAWYKAISRVVIKLPVDTPGRADLLALLGGIGVEWSEEQLGALPSYLEGAIPIGGNRILKTQAPNPWMTVPQVAEGLGAFFPGARRQNAFQLLGEVNPFLSGGVKTIGGLMRGKTSEYGIVGDVLTEIGRTLPASRLINPPSSDLYEDAGRRAEALQYAGIGLRALNRRESAKRAREGR